MTKKIYDYKVATLSPHNISETGWVTFTNGTDTGLIGNRQICEAYGFTFDDRTGTCRLNQQYQPTLHKQLDNLDTKIFGTGNGVESSVRNSMITGNSNLIRSQSGNNFITGKENTIDSRINNSLVMGVNGEGFRQSEFVIGGGVNTQSITEGETTTSTYTNRRMSIIELSCMTTSNATTNMTINGDGSSYITVKNNSIIGYEIYLTRLEVGGSAGTKGDYSYRNRKGVVDIDNAYSMGFIVGFTRNIGKVGGVNGTFNEVDVSSGDDKQWTIQVSDRNNVTNVWSAVVYLHEMISTTETW
jgi:hypothetical protein